MQPPGERNRCAPGRIDRQSRLFRPMGFALNGRRIREENGRAGDGNLTVFRGDGGTRYTSDDESEASADEEAPLWRRIGD